MMKKKRLVLGIGLLAAVIALAFVARDMLADRVDPYGGLDFAQTQGGEPAAADGPAGGPAGGGNGGGDAAVGVEASDGEAPDGSEGSGQDAETTPAIDFGMLDYGGDSVRLADIIANGKPVVINFWASWCPPCKGEMPDFETVYKELGDEVQFMMVNMTDGQRETVELGKQYVEDGGFTFPVYFDTGQEGAIAYGIVSIPTTLFIDSGGNIAAGMVGAIDEATLRKGLDSLTVP